MAQKSYTFNAVALNVDGLPKEISGVSINSDGQEAAGATELCGILANSGWDIVGFSEDFNFHSYLTAAPASTYYNFGEHGGEVGIDAISKASTDGLGIAVSKKLSFPGGKGSYDAWNEEYGGSFDISNLDELGANGADNLITKGFRMYTVTFATGVAVDVYVLHMDAGTADSDDDYDSNGNDKNIVARESQLAQLATYIMANHNNRPVIILGDTNCRYTREQLKTGFIDVINADARFTIKDVWVEHMWGGNYPTYGTDAMMTHTYGAQKGEIVDKIFYINTTESSLTLKANSYLHDESVTVSDHMPVVANFTLTDPNGSAPTDAEKEASWTLEETAASFQKPTWQGEEVVSGTTYYVMNVGTGAYLKWGGSWTAQAVTGYAGHPVTPTLSDGKYKLVTVAGEGRSLGHNLFMDNQENNTWTLTLADNTSNHYYIENESGVLSTESNKRETTNNRTTIVAKNASDDTQKWIFLTEAGMIESMADANPDYPFNFTPMLGAADFDGVDGWNGYAKTHWTNYESYGVLDWWQNPGDHNEYNYSGMTKVNATDAITISQTLSGLPNGNYKFSFEAFYNYILTTTTTTQKRTRSYKVFSGWTAWSDWTTTTSTSTSEQTMNATVTVGSETFTLNPNRSVNVGDAGAASAAFRDGDAYMTTTYQTLSSGTLAVSISKPATSANTTGATTESGGGSTSKSHTKTTPSYAYTNSVHFDNFRLEYRGTQTVAIDPYADYKKIVRDKVNATFTKVVALNDAGQAAYDISFVVSRYNNNQITTSADAEALSKVVDAAYESAYAAHLAADVQDAVDNMDANGGDVTGAIINPSFELGDLTGWTVGEAWDLGAKSASDNTYAAEGSDGAYLFNAYSGDHGYTTSLVQTIKGLPNGLYELKAMLASHGATEAVDANNPKTRGNRVYLIGNDYHACITAERNNKFEEATLYFLVENGTAKIGAIGGSKGTGADFIYYWPWEGCYFKADNFRLKYICDVPHGRLKLALNEANAATLDKYGQAALNISAYETMFANKSLASDGKAEAAAVYTALQAAAKAQKTAGADMTWAITNPNFETGTIDGWTCETGGDTKASPQEDGTYAAVGTDGRYMFNTWSDGTAKALTQTVTGLPAGYYRLEAMLTSDEGSSVTLSSAGSTVYKSTVTPTTKSQMVAATIERLPAHTGSVTITVVGSATASASEGTWFKADNFRLTYLGRHADMFEDLDADEVDEYANGYYTSATLKRSLSADKWYTFVVPFSVEGETFDSLKTAGWEVKELASAVRNGDNVSLRFSDASEISAGVPYMVRTSSAVSALNLTNVDIDMSVVNPQKVDYVTFTGTYSSGNVPQGAFFINNNTFYLAADGTNTTKGYRAWFVPEVANIKALGYSFDDVDFTGIEGVEDNAAEIVAVYSVDGTLRSDLKKGINIVKMSDGTTKKVLVK